MEDERRNIVWEHRTEGTRFMTNYNPDKEYSDNEHHIVVGENLTYKDALVLVKQTEFKNINSFLSDIPDEFRTPEMDRLIIGMIKGG